MSDFLNNKNISGRPDRVSDLEARPIPTRQDNDAAQPWFVEQDPTSKKTINASAKKISKRFISVFATILALTIALCIIAGVLVFVVGIYE